MTEEKIKESTDIPDRIIAVNRWLAAVRSPTEAALADRSAEVSSAQSGSAAGQLP
ncbi:MAG: hypothetical protein M3548_04615 [Actinomycetota bacterium]|nr:hypothetical protein [Actinomycetota bacterium]